MKKNFLGFSILIAIILLIFSFYSISHNIKLDPYIILFITLFTLCLSLADFSKNEILSIILIIGGLIASIFIALKVKNGTHDTTDVDIFINSLTTISLSFVIIALSVKNLKNKKQDSI